MNHSDNSHSRMFLMELIIAILFFSLASTVCLQMFAASRRISGDATALNMAVNQAGNAAELLKHARSTGIPFPDCLLSQYPHTVTDTDKAAVYFDENWNHCETHNAAYFMQITQGKETEGVRSCQIAVWDTADSKDAVYTLDLKLHAPLRP